MHIFIQPKFVQIEILNKFRAWLETSLRNCKAYYSALPSIQWVTTYYIGLGLSMIWKKEAK